MSEKLAEMVREYVDNSERLVADLMSRVEYRPDMKRLEKVASRLKARGVSGWDSFVKEARVSPEPLISALEKLSGVDSGTVPKLGSASTRPGSGRSAITADAWFERRFGN